MPTIQLAGVQTIGASGYAALKGAVTVAGGNGITVTESGQTITAALDAPVSVANGGTGAATLTQYGVLLGNGTGAVQALAAGTAGYVLIGAGSANPAWSTKVKVLAGEVAINDDSADLDFRVESDANAAAFCVDAGTSRVGVNTGTPATVADVRGADPYYWNGSTWSSSMVPPQALSVVNAYSGGYDPVVLFRQADTAGTVKTSGGIGLQGDGSWSSTDLATQVSDLYVALRGSDGSLSERLRITWDGGAVFPAHVTVGDSAGTVAAGAIRYHSGALQYYNGSTWLTIATT